MHPLGVECLGCHPRALISADRLGACKGDIAGDPQPALGLLELRRPQLAVDRVQRCGEGRGPAAIL